MASRVLGPAASRQGSFASQSTQRAAGCPWSTRIAQRGALQVVRFKEGEKQEAVTVAPKWPFARERGTEPAPLFQQLLKDKPVSQVELWDGGKAWLVVRYKDVCSVLSDDEHFSKVRTKKGFPELSAGGRKAAEAGRPTFVDMDPPQHTKQRKMVAPVFTPEAVESLRPYIQHTVDERIRVMREGSSNTGDLIDLFALQVPTQTMLHMLGILPSDMDYLLTQNAMRTSASATSAEAAQAAQELTGYLDKLCRSKVDNPGDDLVSKVAEEQVRTGHLSVEDLIQVTFLLLVAGNATVVGMIALGVVTLLEHPDQLSQIRTDPTLIKGAVEELLRYHTASALATRRICVKDVEVAGQLIRAGEGVICSTQAANRDERVFPNPNTFDIHRDPNPHLGFGYGTHVCVAEWLSRLELQCALGTLFREFPSLQVAVPLDQVQYSAPTHDVGIVKLPVKW